MIVLNYDVLYRNGDQAMIVLMENDVYTLDEIESNLSRDYAKWRYSVSSGEVVLTLPKFRVSSSNKMEEAG